MSAGRVTKATANASIREARDAVRDLATALRQAGPTRDYVLSDDEIIARLCTAVDDVRAALGMGGDDE